VNEVLRDQGSPLLARNHSVVCSPPQMRQTIYRKQKSTGSPVLLALLVR
jgi:hypothetical protein